MKNYNNYNKYQNIYNENILSENEIFMIKNDELIINDIIRDYFLYEKPVIKNEFINNFCQDRRDAINKFLTETKYSSFRTCFHFNYNIYRMNINLSKAKYKGSNNFTYYISGVSGDFYMHQKGMIRATRTINLEVIKHFFPDIKKDKKYREFEKGLIKFSDLDLKPSEKYENYKRSKVIKKFNL